MAKGKKQQQRAQKRREIEAKRKEKLKREKEEEQEEEEGEDESENITEEKQEASENGDGAGEQEIKCKHSKQANPIAIKKLLAHGSSFDCEECVMGKTSKKGGRKPKKNQTKQKKGGDTSNKLWVCLACAHVGCGRNAQAHGVQHYENTKHSLALDSETGNIWCYGCDNEVPFTISGPVKQCFKLFQPSEDQEEEEESKPGSNPPQGKRGRKKKEEYEEILPTLDISGYNGIKGLTNLGNTCFFNSVMQNLTHSIPLRDYLLGRPGFDEGPLTTALRSFMVSMWKDPGRQLTPRTLLNEICKRASRFRGGRQQDSHELLRYLLDGVDTEEKKRLKIPLVSNVSNNKDKDKEKDSNTPKKTFVEQIFGGVLSSTVTCLGCGTVSRVYEPYLDLSLPIPDRFLESKKSHYMPSKRVQRRQQKKGRNNQTAEEPEKKEEKQPEEELMKPPPDIRPPLPSLTECSLLACLHSFTDPEILQGEDGFGCVECTKRELVKRGISFDPNQFDSDREESSSDEEEGEQKEKEQEEKDEATEQEEKEEEKKEEEENGEEKKELKEKDEEKVEKSELKEESTKETEREDKADEENVDHTHTVNEVEDSEKSEQETKELKERVTQEKGESTDSSMKTEQGTQDVPESNGIEHSDSTDDSKEDKPNNKKKSKSNSTKKKDSTKQEEGKKFKLIRRTAMKQFLLEKAPPILTLHLKRFMQTWTGLEKIGKMVSFPMELDIGPYFQDQQATKSRKYKLFGVSVHGGGMGGGHYIAYIRKKLKPNGDDASDTKENVKEQWFYFSDSYYREATESEVLSSQAYILFYEAVDTP